MANDVQESQSGLMKDFPAETSQTQERGQCWHTVPRRLLYNTEGLTVGPCIHTGGYIFWESAPLATEQSSKFWGGKANMVILRHAE